jgi:NAD(P)-dependent dehydrogenase (short-subunit alcohol dehydrogenase family)
MGILDGRRIVVTGGASGMGAASVRSFAREGARVFSIDVNGDAGAQVATDAAALGGDVLFEQCNVASPELDDVMERGIAWLGGLDALANVAGIERGGTPQDSTEEQFEEILEPNLWATIRTNQIACKHMQESGGGRIINYASDAGLGGMPMAPAYSVSKGGVLGWSRSIAREWGVYNIAVVAMCPAIWTPMYEEYRRREPAEMVALSDRMLEGTDPDRDMGPVMVFLASTGANSISGQHIHVGKINVAF